MVQYSYFPGCNLKTNAKGYETSAIVVSKKLNAELVEMPKWNCCGSVHTMSTDNLMKRIASVRDLARAKKHVEELENSPNKVVTLCSMCNSTLKIVNAEVKADKSKLDTINMKLEDDDEAYDGSMEVIHFLEILRDEIGMDEVAKKVTHPLKGLKVAPYYGCMLLHPEMAKIDDEEMPSVMEDLVEALGAEVVFNPYFKYCCGSYHIVDDPDIVNTQITRIIKGARDRGANAIVVACPLCGYNLDYQQKILAEKTGEKNLIPIFYITQLMAVAFGEKITINHFEDHAIDPRPLLKSIGIKE